MKRRDFLHNISHLAAGSFMLPSFANDLNFLDNNSLLSNTIDEGKILLLIKLNGGNDGLNTLIPLDQYANLTQVRPHVILPENRIIDLGTNDLGLHPELSNFKSLFDEDRMKIIQNVGYSNPDFSHFRAMDVWESGSTSNQYVTSGWLGRYLEDQHPNYPTGYPTNNYPHPLSVEMRRNSLLMTGVNSFTSFVVNEPENFYEIINEFDNNYDTSSNFGVKLDYMQMVAKQSNVYGEILRDIYMNSETQIPYGNSNLDRQFDIVNRLIHGGLNTRIYMLELEGFDTHDRQVDTSDNTQGAHAILLRQLNDSIGKFMQNMDAIGRSDDVLLMTYSEFGRTIVSNGSYGTDHGTAAPLFIFGNKIDPTIAGHNPRIPQNAVWQDNLDAEFDFKQIYSSIINQWLSKGPETEQNVLFKSYDQLSIIDSQYIDSDGDGVSDDQDLCNTTAAGAIVDLNGCAIFTLPAENFNIQTNGVSCVGTHNGRINISVVNTNHVYRIAVPETSNNYVLNSGNQHQVQIDGLGIGTYSLNVSVEGEPNYLQTFEIGITEPASFVAKTAVNQKRKSLSVSASGSDLYLVELNGESKIYDKESFDLKLVPGYNRIEISTPQDCQGKHTEEIFISEQIKHFPNPVDDVLNLVIPGKDTSTFVEVYDRSGALLKTEKKSIPFSRIVKVNTVDLSKEIYIVKVKGNTVDQTFKIQKR
ncbi:MAG: DUF1501 domain-containing protein [Wenyingzhuangia sp.]|uniref:DUF1501 domain-containing protein n=1 Tax=Wenyingzhuangia sp. TaxID=1964193 RepID=UPI00321BF678